MKKFVSGSKSMAQVIVSRSKRIEGNSMTHAIWMRRLSKLTVFFLHYLWRAVDQDGDELDILVQKCKNKKATMRFFKQLLKVQKGAPLKAVTDKLKSYSAARKELIPSVEHSTVQYQNNWCELSHQPTRQQEKQMRKFKSHGQARRFLSCHGVVNNLFLLGRHLLKAKHYRTFRDRSFAEWNRVSCVQDLD